MEQKTAVSFPQIYLTSRMKNKRFESFGIAIFVCLLGLTSYLLTSCRQNNSDNVLQHPALSLIERDSSRIYWNPTWSADSELLTLTGTDKCFVGNCNQEIYILDPSNGELNHFRDGWRRHLTWTTDPQVVSFVDYDHVPGGIYTSNLEDNSSPEFVVEGDTPVWAPNGDLLAFRRVRRETNQKKDSEPGIYILDLATNIETHIFEVTGKEITGMSWSFDSNWIAISARWKTSNEDFDSGIFIFGRDGEELHREIERGETIGTGIGWMPNSEWLFYLQSGNLIFVPTSFDCFLNPLGIAISSLSPPVISPDGEKIAIEHEGDIYSLALDELLGENREVLTCP